ncbi:MAG TPA: transketolase [Spirochaetia bacterium]|nr:transketolase [Spirochaetia bacterium]
MNKSALEAVALSVRSLTMDAVQAANAGHPGMPMGMAELGALLFGELMNYYPGDWKWPNRDRLVLSAGHGSMWLYSLLHLSGYDLTLDDLRKFRQVGSRTPGHPEYAHTHGIETTTGPLGQGITNAVGFAIGEAIIAGTFNTKDHKLVDHFTYVVAGDGDLMEGISGEASSIAGHLKLGKLIVFYDSNHITIEGSTELAFTEDVLKRYEAYGWHTQEGDAYDFEGIAAMTKKAQAESGRPSIILLHSIIGKGSPNKQGTADVHGTALGPDEVKLTKRNLGIPEDQNFFIHPEAKPYLAARVAQTKKSYEQWKETFAAWAAANPELKQQWDRYMSGTLSFLESAPLPDFRVGDNVATRTASGKVLQAIATVMPNLVGGAADLSPSTDTAMPAHGDFSIDNPTGRTFHFGIREHAMGGIANGLAIYGGLRPFCATFLVFSDYMRGSVRLSSIMKIPVVYVFTHDSIFVGEDGPTHEPIEQVAALRAIPDLRVLRPGDAQETAQAWLMALERADGPTVLALTRQKLQVYEKADVDWKANIRKGAYVVSDCEGTPEIIIVATGSEVGLAVEAAKSAGRKTRIISMISRELFQSQNLAFRQNLIPKGIRTIVVEAGVSMGWEGIATSEQDLFTLHTFGASGKGEAVAEYLGFSKDALVRLIKM